MNTNSNTYTLVYASAVVLIVALLLAIASVLLGPASRANERIDKKKQILAALNVRDLPDDSVEQAYARYIVADPIINSRGTIVKKGQGKDKDGFAVDKKDFSDACLPLYVCNVGDSKKYVIPLSGKGLWGSIWGYIAINDDGNTVYGVYFSHESETAGLGARIADADFQQQFRGKTIGRSGKIELSVVKHGNVTDATTQCDGISGATLTCQGVDQMLHEGLAKYQAYLQKDSK